MHEQSVMLSLMGLYIYKLYRFSVCDVSRKVETRIRFLVQQQLYHDKVSEFGAEIPPKYIHGRFSNTNALVEMSHMGCGGSRGLNTI